MKGNNHKEIMEFWEKMRKEKGINGEIARKPPVTPGKGGLPSPTQAEADAEAEVFCSLGQLLGAVNILLIEAYEFSKCRNLHGIVAGMDIFLDRTGLKKEWIPIIPDGLDIPLFEFAKSTDEGGGSDG